MRPEDQLQKSVARLLDFSGLVWSATANGAFLQGNSQQRAIRGMRLKQHGVKNGVPDVLIFDRCMSGFPNGLAIELKVGKNKPTPTQIEWRDKLRKCGWRWECCYTLDEVTELLRECYPDKFRAI